MPAIPRTLTGKKLEAPVKRILRGEPAEQVASRDVARRPGGARRVRRAGRRALGRQRSASDKLGAARSGPRARPEGERQRERLAQPRSSRRSRRPPPSSPERWRRAGRRRRRAARVVDARSWPPRTCASTSAPTHRTPADFQGAVTRRPIGDLMLVDCAAVAVPRPPRRRDHRRARPTAARGRARLPVRPQGRRAGARGRPRAHPHGRRRRALGRPAADRDRDRRAVLQAHAAVPARPRAGGLPAAGRARRAARRWTAAARRGCSSAT